MRQQLNVASLLITFSLFLSGMQTSIANEVEIVDVTHQCDKNYVCSFNVTLQHKDTGWDHYANQWEVLGENGEILGTRTLHHPHVSEQPFTRSLLSIKIPSDAKQIKIRARDSVHGLSKKYFVISLN
jgi:hypothetical protein